MDVFEAIVLVALVTLLVAVGRLWSGRELQKSRRQSPVLGDHHATRADSPRFFTGHKIVTSTW
jgi:hypothetical protein